MIRRFNYTKRRALPADRVSVKLRKTSDGVMSFDADLRLDGLKLPPDADVLVEAYYKSSYMRFPFGKVNSISIPENRSLSEIDRGRIVQFRVKVVDRSSAHGKILAELDDIVADESGSGGGAAGKYSILPVNFRPLGQELWKLDFSGPRPVLEVNQYDGVEEFVRKDPLFLALVFPAAIREILYHIVVVERHEESEDLTSPWNMWLAFARQFHPEPLPARVAEDDVFTEQFEWIDGVVRGFCEKLRAKDRLVEAQSQEGD